MSVQHKEGVTVMSNYKEIKADQRLEFRCTAEQKKQLQKLAKIAGVSVSGYILGALLGDSVGQMMIDGFSSQK